MRSPRDHRSSRRRSPTLYQNKDRKRSASPSPPRPTAKTLKAIRITVSNVPGKPPTGTRLTSKQNEPDFKGPEDVLPRSKEQKKIQIEIRRSISSKRARTTSPVRRSIRDPENTVQITRSSNEGKSPLFDRDEIKHFVKKDSEQRVVAIIPEKNHHRAKERSRSPLDRMHGKDDRKPVHDRLGEFRNRQDRDHRVNNRSDRDAHNDRPSHDTHNNHLGNNTSTLHNTNNRILDREEIEFRRPQVKPWEVNPEYVPRKSFYFEHDNREDFRGSGTGSFRGQGYVRGYRGGFNRGGRGGRGRGGFVKRSRVDDFGDWKHDKFRDDDGDVDRELS